MTLVPTPDKPSTSAHHILGAQILDDDSAVALGVGRGKNMQGVIALATDLAVQFGYAKFYLLSVLRSFLPK